MIAITPRRTARRLAAHRRRQHHGALRLFLFQGGNPAATSNTGLRLLEIDDGGDEGEYLASWRPDVPDRERGEEPSAQPVMVGIRDDWTRAVLRSVLGYAIVDGDAATGELFRCSPAGVVHLESEGAYRFLGESIWTAWPVPVASGEGSPLGLLLAITKAA